MNHDFVRLIPGLIMFGFMCIFCTDFLFFVAAKHTLFVPFKNAFVNVCK